MDEIMGQKNLKYFSQIQLVMTRIPTKALFKLQVSVAQEVQSHTHTHTQQNCADKGQQEELELVLKKVNLETKDEKYCVDVLE
jgi:hypothetical protein